MAKKIAIITARGGSKRIPKKNIKVFCGNPIISYSIKAAIESKVFDEIMVSTDSEEIAKISLEYGAQVPFMRSEKTSDDYATTQDVLMEVLANYEKKGITFDYMCCIYPTAPFVTGDKLKKAMELLESQDTDLIMPVVPYSFPPQRCNVINKSGYLSYKFDEFRTVRSQDLETWYHDAGQFYCYNVNRYIKNNGVSKKISPIIVSELEVQDIDNETDWKLAEMKYSLMNEK